MLKSNTGRDVGCEAGGHGDTATCRWWKTPALSLRGAILDVFSASRDACGWSSLAHRGVDARFDRPSEPSRPSSNSCCCQPGLFFDSTRRQAERAIREAAESSTPTCTRTVGTDPTRSRGRRTRRAPTWLLRKRLSSVFSYLHRWHPAPIFLGRCPTPRGGARGTLREAERSHADERQELILPPGAHFLSQPELEAELMRFRAPRGGLTIDIGEAPLNFTSVAPGLRSRSAAPRRKVRCGRSSTSSVDGRRGAPSGARRGSMGQPTGWVALLVERAFSRGPPEPLSPTPPASSIWGDQPGFVDAGERLVVLSDEDIWPTGATRGQPAAA